jgi:hypothetical protein
MLLYGELNCLAKKIIKIAGNNIKWGPQLNEKNIMMHYRYSI